MRSRLRRLRSARRRFSLRCSPLETKCIFSRKVLVIRSATTPLLKRRISCSTDSPSRRSTCIDRQQVFSKLPDGGLPTAVLLTPFSRNVHGQIHRSCQEPELYAIERRDAMLD